MIMAVSQSKSGVKIEERRLKEGRRFGESERNFGGRRGKERRKKEVYSRRPARPI